MTRYGLEGRRIGLRFLVRATDFSLLYSIETNSGAHPAAWVGEAVIPRMGGGEAGS
jgi:hypothetical protein